MSTIQGKVKWFNGKKGYGFIERDDKEKDAFVHASAVKAAGMRFLNEGDKIEFTLEDGPKGPSAVKAAGLRYLNEGDKLEFTLEDGPKGPSAVNLKKID